MDIDYKSVARKIHKLTGEALNRLKNADMSDDSYSYSIDSTDYEIGTTIIQVLYELSAPSELSIEDMQRMKGHIL